MINWKELLEADAGKRALEFQRDDEQPKLGPANSFKQGGSTERERLVRAIEVIEAISNETEVHYSSFSKWAKDLSDDFLAELRKELESK